ncbi:MAG: hypothetical protein E6K60_02785 [Nitrospirae bacterium]|nr:MAG: hypothetical protein E6K60_02785 [Nitrospirota bacterium]
MLAKQTEETRRENVFMELEKILRAMDRLPAEKRMAQLRELAAGSPPQATLIPPTTKSSIADAAYEINQRRLKRLKLMCQQFLLSRNTCRVLQNFVAERLSSRSKQVLSLSRSRGRLSPLQQIVWNVAPFFKHSERTDSRKTGYIAWEEVVRFLEIAQDAGKTATKKKTIPKIVNRSSRLKNDAHRLRIIYQRIQDEAPQTSHSPTIMTLLARHGGNGSA